MAETQTPPVVAQTARNTETRSAFHGKAKMLKRARNDIKVINNHVAAIDVSQGTIEDCRALEFSLTAHLEVYCESGIVLSQKCTELRERIAAGK